MEFRARNKLAAQADNLQTNVKHIRLASLHITIAITLLLHILLHLPLLLLFHLLLLIHLLLLFHLLLLLHLLLHLQLPTNNRNRVTLQNSITVLKQYISQATIWEEKEGIWTKEGQLEIWTAVNPEQTTTPTKSQNTTKKAITSLKKILNSR